jgi:MATE family multidrug resistance protein
MEPQIIFFDILTYGSILILIRHSLASFFCGIGRTRAVMAASGTAMVMNIVASYVLIYGRAGFPALGIAGAAIGNLTGSFSGILVLAAFYFGKKNREEFSVKTSLGFHAPLLKKLLRYGTPSGLEMFLTLLAANGMILGFHSMGPVVATASSILFNWDMTAYIPLMGMEIGATSLVGRYMGARRPDIAHQSVMSGLKVGSVYALVLLFLFGFFAGPLVTVFRPSEASVLFAEAQPLAILMLRMISVYMFSIVLVVIFVGALRGAGDTLWAMTYHVTLHWMTVLVLYVSTRMFGLSPAQAWMLVILSFLASSVIAWLRYRSGNWRKLYIIE